MKFCSKCGAQLKNDSQLFCTVCGARVEEQIGATFYEVEYNEYEPEYQMPVNRMQPYPMKWYKFLIYVELFLNAVLNVVTGILYITGGIYSMRNINPDYIYNFFGELETINIIYGFLAFGFAAFCIYTRYRLANYKSNGPLCVFCMYGISAVMNLGYTIITNLVISSHPLTNGNVQVSYSLIANIVTSIVMIVLNIIYFNKRKSLFVNE